MKLIIIIVNIILLISCTNDFIENIKKNYIYTLNQNEYISNNPHTHSLIFVDNQPFWWLVTHDDNSTFLIFNGHKGPGFDFISIDSITLASNGRLIVYLAYKDDKKYIVNSNYQGNTQISEGYDQIIDLLVSKDCENVIFYGVDKGEYFLVNNGERLPLTQDSSVLSVQMSKDGSNIYYEINIANQLKKVLNGQIVDKIDVADIDTVVLSPYKSLAFLSHNNRPEKGKYLIIDYINKSGRFHDINPQSIIFS